MKIPLISYNYWREYKNTNDRYFKEYSLCHIEEWIYKKFIDKEIYIREKFINLPVTKIIKQSQNALWFCEEYIHGISPNRMHADGKETLQKVVERLNEMLIETRKK